ncbi:MAG: 3-deoxy-D-manno-octulosonic acid transferase [Prevotella sp.]|nr:3-deoxy-D-manno-octulosonic acid transferase [Prevotella sp.]
MELVEKLFPVIRILRNQKLRKFVAGQSLLLQTICDKMAEEDKEIIWIHASSLGEYGVARPIIHQLRSEKRTIVFTFFSPSAYEVLNGRNREETGIDYVFYLPWDTQHNAQQFLDAVHPAKAIFIISEYWINYLRELDQRQIPTYFISSLVHRESYLLKWYGRPIRNAIPKNSCFFALDEDTKRNLNSIGFHHATVIGDSLFDNAIGISQTPYSNDIIQHFCATADKGVMIAGSISDRHDMDIVCSFANTHPGIKCIFVPHEISEEGLNEIKYHLEGWAELYSDCTAETDFSRCQVLIIDFMGSLSRLYRYGRWAYVGGGFTPYLHNVIEPIVYGLPAAFGPRIYRKTTPQQMISLGVGHIVRSAREFSAWFDRLYANEQEMEKIKTVALSYVSKNSGATQKVVRIINDHIRL